jgi:hypothetical protein
LTISTACRSGTRSVKLENQYPQQHHRFQGGPAVFRGVTLGQLLAAAHQHRPNLLGKKPVPILVVKECRYDRADVLEQRPWRVELRQAHRETYHQTAEPNPIFGRLFQQNQLLIALKNR